MELHALATRLGAPVTPAMLRHVLLNAGVGYPENDAARDAHTLAEVKRVFPDAFADVKAEGKKK